jgi:hypothetical protein
MITNFIAFFVKSLLKFKFIASFSNIIELKNLGNVLYKVKGMWENEETTTVQGLKDMGEEKL